MHLMPTAKVSRTRAGPLEDAVQVELVRLHFSRFAPTVALGVFGLVIAVYLLAFWYRDPILWRIAHASAIIGGLRLAFVIAAVFAMRGNFTSRQAHLWQNIYSGSTFAFCVALAVTTVYNFAAHDETGRLLSTIGTFSICSGISGRIGLRPRITQLCGCLMLASLAFALLRYEHSVVRFGAVACAAFGYAYCESVQNKFALLVEQIQNRRNLRHLSESDALTGLANRRHFEQALAAAAAGAQNFCVFLIDLDRFKPVNDTFGHHTGDALLKLVAARLNSLIRQPALIARLGGDEFAVLLAPFEGRHAESLASRINHTLATPFQVEGHELNIGASIGIHLGLPGDASPRDILIHADTALYKAKAAGRNGFKVAT